MEKERHKRGWSDVISDALSSDEDKRAEREAKANMRTNMNIHTASHFGDHALSHKRKGQTRSVGFASNPNTHEQTFTEDAAPNWTQPITPRTGTWARNAIPSWSRNISRWSFPASSFAPSGPPTGHYPFAASSHFPGSAPTVASGPGGASGFHDYSAAHLGPIPSQPQQPTTTYLPASNVDAYYVDPGNDAYLRPVGLAPQSNAPTQSVFTAYPPRPGIAETSFDPRFGSFRGTVWPPPHAPPHSAQAPSVFVRQLDGSIASIPMPASWAGNTVPPTTSPTVPATTSPQLFNLRSILSNLPFGLSTVASLGGAPSTGVNPASMVSISNPLVDTSGIGLTGPVYGHTIDNTAPRLNHPLYTWGQNTAPQEVEHTFGGISFKLDPRYDVTFMGQAPPVQKFNPEVFKLFLPDKKLELEKFGKWAMDRMLVDDTDRDTLLTVDTKHVEEFLHPTETYAESCRREMRECFKRCDKLREKADWTTPLEDFAKQHKMCRSDLVDLTLARSGSKAVRLPYSVLSHAISGFKDKGKNAQVSMCRSQLGDFKSGNEIAYVITEGPDGDGQSTIISRNKDGNWTNARNYQTWQKRETTIVPYQTGSTLLSTAHSNDASNAKSNVPHTLKHGERVLEIGLPKSEWGKWNKKTRTYDNATRRIVVGPAQSVWKSGSEAS